MNKFLLVYMFFFTVHLHGQGRLLKGRVMDSLQQALPFANVMAKPFDHKKSFVFAVTNDEGLFEMKLLEKTVYKVTVSFMGYYPYTFQVDSLQKPAFQKIILKPSQQDLDEVVISYETPVKITSDSIVYNVKHFVKGNERKLKAVLNKLPGVKVDKNGQITVMGERITKLMVEGKDFFGGDSKLAVENIPADAVKSVQVLKDYNRVSFMKGLTDEQKTVINIKLKEGKKRFVFGDLLAGSNTDNNYLAKANLFYFSPKSNLTYIGNINDYGESSLTLQDIRRFEGNKDAYARDILNIRNQNNLYGFVSKNNFLNKNIQFNAFQWQQDFGNYWDFQLYSIVSNEKNTYKKQYDNLFLIEPLIHQREIDDESVENNSVLTKMELIYEPRINQHYNLKVSFNKTLQGLMKNTLMQSDVENNKLYYDLDNDKINYYQSFIFYHKFSKKHILRFFSYYNYQEENPLENWTTEQIFMENYLDWHTADIYTLFQNKNLNTHTFNNILKYYYKLNTHNHLYFSLGNSYSYSSFYNNLIQPARQQDYLFSDFLNDFDLKINDLYAGLQYRFKIGSHMVTSGLYLHYLKWDNTAPVYTRTEYLWLPELNYEAKILGGKLIVNYALKTELPPVEYFVSNKILKDYDRVLWGNPDLTYELYHQLQARYNRYSLVHKILFFVQADYKKYLSILKQNQIIEETEFFTVPSISSQAGHHWMLMSGFSKEWKQWSFEYNPAISFGKTYDFINNQILKNNQYIIINSVVFETDFTKLSDFRVGISCSYMQNDKQGEILTYQEVEPFVEAELTYKSFTLQTDYKLQYIKNAQEINDTYQLWNFSLSIKKEDKPLEIALEVKNILNQEYIYFYSTSSYMATQKFTFIQPQIWMLKLGYKL